MFEICEDCVWRYRCPEMEEFNPDEEGCSQKRVHGQREVTLRPKPGTFMAPRIKPRGSVTKRTEK